MDWPHFRDAEDDPPHIVEIPVLVRDYAPLPPLITSELANKGKRA